MHQSPYTNSANRIDTTPGPTLSNSIANLVLACYGMMPSVHRVTVPLVTIELPRLNKTITSIGGSCCTQSLNSYYIFEPPGKSNANVTLPLLPMDTSYRPFIKKEKKGFQTRKLDHSGENCLITAHALKQSL